jgi:antitoxin HicB
MMLSYRIALEPDDNGTFLVTCPALPEVTTFAESHTEALKHAADAIEEALSARIAARGDIPAGDELAARRSGDAVVDVPLLQSLKVSLYLSARRQNVSPAELARRLDWHREQVDRLFRLDHASRLDQIEAAFGVMDQQVSFRVEPARRAEAGGADVDLEGRR